MADLTVDTYLRQTLLMLIIPRNWTDFHSRKTKKSRAFCSIWNSPAGNQISFSRGRGSCFKTDEKVEADKRMEGCWEEQLEGRECGWLMVKEASECDKEERREWKRDISKIYWLSSVSSINHLNAFWSHKMQFADLSSLEEDGDRQTLSWFHPLHPHPSLPCLLSAERACCHRNPIWEHPPILSSLEHLNKIWVIYRTTLATRKIQLQHIHDFNQKRKFSDVSMNMNADKFVHRMQKKPKLLAYIFYVMFMFLHLKDLQSRHNDKVSISILYVC